MEALGDVEARLRRADELLQRARAGRRGAQLDSLAAGRRARREDLGRQHRAVAELVDRHLQGGA